jgi:hypothetical protein
MICYFVSSFMSSSLLKTSMKLKSYLNLYDFAFRVQYRDEWKRTNTPFRKVDVLSVRHLGRRVQRGNHENEAVYPRWRTFQMGICTEVYLHIWIRRMKTCTTLPNWWFPLLRFRSALHCGYSSITDIQDGLFFVLTRARTFKKARYSIFSFEAQRPNLTLCY